MASDTKNISNLTDEINDNSLSKDYFLAIEQPNLSGLPTTYKIKQSTLLSGVLAPSGGNVSAARACCRASPRYA